MGRISYPSAAAFIKAVLSSNLRSLWNKNIAVFVITAPTKKGEIIFRAHACPWIFLLFKYRPCFYSMTLLTDILERYSSFNNTHGTDKTTHHSYGDLYNNIFEPLQIKTDVSVLEIGILTGAFLQALSEYLHPSAIIHGIDIDVSNMIFAKNTPNVYVYQLDGTLKESAEKLNHHYDVIVEDGSHLPDHQCKTLDAFAPYLKEGGVYIIEDIHEACSGELQKHLCDISFRHGLVMEWHDLRDKKNRFDDIVATFRRQAS